jgi:glutamate synthase domain-containing protein 3
MSGGVVFIAFDAPFDPSAPPISLGPTNLALGACVEDDPDVRKLRALLERHAEATGSPRAVRLLADWPRALERFAKLAAPRIAPAEVPAPEPERDVTLASSK